MLPAAYMRLSLFLPRPVSRKRALGASGHCLA